MATKEEMISGITVARRNAKLSRRLTAPDIEWWEEIRDEEIKPELERAAEALSETGIGGKYERRNGGSGVALLAGGTYHLTFTHENGGIQVTSSEAHLNERWDDRKHVTTEAVGSKVMAFLVWIARVYPDAAETSIYDQRFKEGKPLLTTL